MIMTVTPSHHPFQAYPRRMPEQVPTSGTTTDASAYFRALIENHRVEVENVLRRYNATNPRLFGSVARGDANASSDIDILVDLSPGHGNLLLRIAGIGEELRRVLGMNVDVIAPSLMRNPVAATAIRDLVPL